MENSKMKELYEQFYNSCFPTCYGYYREGLNKRALQQLKGEYLAMAKTVILDALKQAPDSRPISAASDINLVEAIPIMDNWIRKMRTDPAGEYYNPRLKSKLAYALYELSQDQIYISELVDAVKGEEYSDFDIGVRLLGHVPLTSEGILAVWERYKRGKVIKYPVDWRNSCAYFLRNKIDEPIGQQFLSVLPDDERKELLEFIKESAHQRLERKFRLEKYVYGPERYASEDVNRYHEYIRVGGSPINGMTLTNIWEGGTDKIQGINWSPDGRYLAIFDKTIQVWKLDNGEKFRDLIIQDEMRTFDSAGSVVWAESGTKLAALYDYVLQGESRTKISVWDIEREHYRLSIDISDKASILSKLLGFFDDRILLFAHLGKLFLLDLNHLKARNKKKKIVQKLFDLKELFSFLEIGKEEQKGITGKRVDLLAEKASLAKSQQYFDLADIADKLVRLDIEECQGKFGVTALSSSKKMLAIGFKGFANSKVGVTCHPNIPRSDAIYNVLIYDLEAKSVMHNFATQHVQYIRGLVWMPNKPVLAIGSADNTVSIWDIQKKQMVTLLESEGYVGPVTGMSFSADGTLFASRTGQDNFLRIWRTDTWEIVVVLSELHGINRTLEFHPTEPVLASLVCVKPDGSLQNSVRERVRIWTFDNECFLGNDPFMGEFEKSEANIRTKLAQGEITEDLEYIRIGGSPIKGIKLAKVLAGHTDRVHNIAWSPDGQFLASPSDDSTVRIWDQTTGMSVSIVEEAAIKHTAWSPDGRILVYGGNREVKLWDMVSEKSMNILELPSRENGFQRLDALAFSSDGKMLALAYGYDTLQILETSTWSEITRTTFDERGHRRINVQWTNNDQQLMVNTRNGAIQLWDVATMSLAKEIVAGGEYDEYRDLVYAVSNDFLVVIKEKEPIKIWDLKNGMLLKEVGQPSMTSGLNFSPDGKLLVTCSRDHYVRFLCSATLNEVARIEEYPGGMIEPVYPRFHPYKSRLATFCDKRRSIRIWEIDQDTLLNAI